MKYLLLLGFFFLVLSCDRGRTQNIAAMKLNPSRNMEWEDVDQLIKDHIQRKPSLEQGIVEIQNLLSQDNNQRLVENIDLPRLKIEFNDFLKKTMKDNPIPEDVKGISFGLFTMLDNVQNRTTLYLCGSERSPIEDSFDWNVDPLYFPKYYCILKDFENINRTYPKLTGDQEVLVFNGIVNLLIINSIHEFKLDILKYQDKMYVGGGFDAGDTYILGQLSDKGLN